MDEYDNIAIQELIKWLDYHAKNASPHSQVCFSSVLRKISELGLDK